MKILISYCQANGDHSSLQDPPATITAAATAAAAAAAIARNRGQSAGMAVPHPAVKGLSHTVQEPQWPGVPQIFNVHQWPGAPANYSNAPFMTNPPQASTSRLSPHRASAERHLPPNSDGFDIEAEEPEAIPTISAFLADLQVTYRQGDHSFQFPQYADVLSRNGFEYLDQLIGKTSVDIDAIIKQCDIKLGVMSLILRRADAQYNRIVKEARMRKSLA